jgi:hypothetical protein
VEMGLLKLLQGLEDVDKIYTLQDKYHFCVSLQYDKNDDKIFVCSSFYIRPDISTVSIDVPGKGDLTEGVSSGPSIEDIKANSSYACFIIGKDRSKGEADVIINQGESRYSYSSYRDFNENQFNLDTSSFTNENNITMFNGDADITKEENDFCNWHLDVTYDYADKYLNEILGMHLTDLGFGQAKEDPSYQNKEYPIKKLPDVNAISGKYDTLADYVKSKGEYISDGNVKYYDLVSSSKKNLISYFPDGFGSVKEPLFAFRCITSSNNEATIIVVKGSFCYCYLISRGLDEGGKKYSTEKTPMAYITDSSEGNIFSFDDDDYNVIYGADAAVQNKDIAECYSGSDKLLKEYGLPSMFEFGFGK